MELKKVCSSLREKCNLKNLYQRGVVLGLGIVVLSIPIEVSSRFISSPEKPAIYREFSELDEEVKYLNSVYENLSKGLEDSTNKKIVLSELEKLAQEDNNRLEEIQEDESLQSYFEESKIFNKKVKKRENQAWGLAMTGTFVSFGSMIAYSRRRKTIIAGS